MDPEQGELVRAALGSSQGDDRFDPRADLNRDGHINVLDTLRAHGGGTSAATGPPPLPGLMETIFIDNDTEFIQAGGLFTVMVRLDNNIVPLFGYSVEIEAVPIDGAVGAVEVVDANSSWRST